MTSWNVTARVSILALAGLALLGWLWSTGVLLFVWQADHTPLTAIIVTLFTFGLACSLREAVRVDRLNRYQTGQLYSVVWQQQRVKHLWQISQWLTYLGLLGTVIGLWIGFQGITPNDPTASINHLLAGLKVGLGTTVTGAFFGLWMEKNHLLVETAAVRQSTRGKQD